MHPKRLPSIAQKTEVIINYENQIKTPAAPNLNILLESKGLPVYPHLHTLAVTCKPSHELVEQQVALTILNKIWPSKICSLKT